MNIDGLNEVKVSENYVLKDSYEQFKKEVEELYGFLHIFKPDLKI